MATATITPRRRLTIKPPEMGQLPETVRVEPKPLSRESLRAGKWVYIVDDSESMCLAEKRILDGPYKERVRYCTDPVKALAEAAELAKKGELHLLVLDMQMPGLSGGDLALRLSNLKGVRVPIVVVSGGQGHGKWAEFNAKLTGAHSMADLDEAAGEALSRTGRYPLGYVPKEDVVLHPERLVNGLDSMLRAQTMGARWEPKLLEMATTIETASALNIPEGKLDPLIVMASDEILAFVSANRAFQEKLRKAVSEEKPLPGKEQELKDLMDGGGGEWGIKNQFTSTWDHTYPEIRDSLVVRRMDIEHWAHGIMGSRGMQRYLNDLMGVCTCFDDKYDKDAPVRVLIDEEFGPAMERFKERFYSVSGRMIDLSHAEDMTVDTMAAELMGRAGKKGKLDFLKNADSKPLKVEGNRQALTESMQLAIDNACKAVAREDEGVVRLGLGRRRVLDIDHPDIRKHFIAKGYSDEDEIGFVEVSDNGPGFPEGVLEAWRGHKTVRRGGTGEPSQGLDLIRRRIRAVNGGDVAIDSSPQGSKVTLYFGMKPRE
ncbi:MAG: response regulator [Candidatus Altiarchaeota archaeon]